MCGPVWLLNEFATGNIYEDDARSRLTLPPDIHVEGSAFGVEVETPIGPMRVEIGSDTSRTSARQQAKFSIGSWH